MYGFKKSREEMNMINKIKILTILIVLFSISFFVSDAQVNNEKFDKILLETLPEDFPPITVDINNNPSKGQIYLSTADIIFNQGINPKSKYGAYFMKIDNEGNPLAFKKVNLASADYKMHANGLESYGNSINPVYILALEVEHLILDKKFNVIDTLQCGNGYIADFHEFHILPNGHYLLIAWEEIMMDLSKIFPNASPSSKVIATVYQELDANKNVVFQWRSLDHLSLSELAPYILGANTFDQARGNSGFPDFDGNFIFSFPSTNEVMKVNRTTGEVMWRLGGRQNQFTFINEHEENAPNYFSWQHFAHRLNNGNILMFDNGIFKNPSYSRAVEYKLDEVNKTCELVWEYRHDPDIVCNFGGGAQRLKNGNTLISWGMVGSKVARTATEVTPNKEVVYELSIPRELISYRAYRFDSTMCDVIAKVDVNEVLEGNTYRFNKGKDSTAVTMTFERMNGFMYNTFTMRRFECAPMNPIFEQATPWIYPMRYEFSAVWVNNFKANAKINTKLLKSVANPAESKVYFRATPGEGVFVLVPTQYNPDTKELLFDAYAFGEYIIGVPYPEQSAIKPHLTYPVNNAKVDITDSVTLKWSLLGYATSADLQVAKDIDFNDKIIDESELKTALRTIEDLQSGTTYYWRVKAKNDFGESEWSDIWSFIPTEPFIDIVYPNGGEMLGKEPYKSILRWDKNTFDTVRIELYRNNQFHSIIRDTFYTTTNAFAWTITGVIPDGNDYKIKVVSISNSNFSAMSNEFFSIGTVDVVDNKKLNELNFTSYPNPFSDETKFKFRVPEYSRAVLNIFDMNGRLISNVFDEYLEEGNYLFNWDASNLASGVYLARIMVGSQLSVQTISIVR
jgi:hypothetical protein